MEKKGIPYFSLLSFPFPNANNVDSDNLYIPKISPLVLVILNFPKSYLGQELWTHSYPSCMNNGATAESDSQQRAATTLTKQCSCCWRVAPVSAVSDVKLEAQWSILTFC